MADFILNTPLRFFARVFGNPAGDPVLLKSRGVTLLRDRCEALTPVWRQFQFEVEEVAGRGHQVNAKLQALSPFLL